MANGNQRFYKLPYNILEDSRVASLAKAKDMFATTSDDPGFWQTMMVFFAIVQSAENNQAGIFRFSPHRIAADSRVDISRIRENLDRLQKVNLIRWDEQTAMVAILDDQQDEYMNNENRSKGLEKFLQSIGDHPFVLAKLASVQNKTSMLHEILQSEKCLPSTPQVLPKYYPSTTQVLLEYSNEQNFAETSTTQVLPKYVDVYGDVNENGNGNEDVNENENLDLDFKTAPQIEWPPDEYDAPSEHTPNEPNEIKAKEEQKPKRNSRKDQKAKAEAYAQAVTAYWEQNQEELKGYAPNRDYENFIPQVEGWCYAKPANAAKKSLKETHLKAFIKNWLQGMPEIKPSYLPQNREKWAHHAMALHAVIKAAWEAKADELRKRFPQRAYGVVIGALEAWILNNHEKCQRHEATEEGAIRLIESFLSRANVIPEWGIGDESAEVAELEDRYRYAELVKYKVNRSEADKDLDTIAYGDSLGGPECLSGMDYDEYQAASRRVRLAKEYCAKFNRPLPFTREGISGNADWDSEAMREHRRGIQAVIEKSLGPDQKAMPGVLTRDQQEAASCQK